MPALLDPNSLRQTGIIWAIEEFINLPLFEMDDDELEQQIIELRLGCIVVLSCATKAQ